jgi:hypothetical protein
MEAYSPSFLRVFVSFWERYSRKSVELGKKTSNAIQKMKKLYYLQRRIPTPVHRSNGSSTMDFIKIFEIMFSWILSHKKMPE